ncbi:MAG: hypothetical protein GYB65_18100, partial [Chloroflexi bacterium]|nr:hypothetical protein [Chloroflexota bacterium]
FIEGWNNRLYAAEGAAVDNYGTSTTPVAEVSSALDAGTITFIFPGEGLGSPESLEGVRLYITTWDWNGPDSAYRVLTPDGSQWGFGGGDGATDPLIADATEVIEIAPASPAALSIEDPANDDTGPVGVYTRPTDESFGAQMDIRAVDVVPSDDYLELVLTMGAVTEIWGPPNGFDHVLFHVYVDLPGQDGATVLPKINANAPEGFNWDYLAFVEGWNNRLYAAEGADADNYGTSTTPVAEVSSDLDAGTVTIRLSAEALGNPASWSGTQLYIATWDWNGPASAYRMLTPDGSQWGFGGGDGATDPLIADATAVITVP